MAIEARALKLASLVSENNQVTRLPELGLSTNKGHCPIFSAALRYRMCHDLVLTEKVMRADFRGDALHCLGSNAFDVVA
jgi:hypothetical protein